MSLQRLLISFDYLKFRLSLLEIVDKHCSIPKVTEANSITWNIAREKHARDGLHIRRRIWTHILWPNLRCIRLSISRLPADKIHTIRSFPLARPIDILLVGRRTEPCVCTKQHLRVIPIHRSGDDRVRAVGIVVFRHHDSEDFHEEVQERM